MQRIRLGLGVTSAVLILATAGFASEGRNTRDSQSPLPLKVSGTRVLNSRGDEVLLRGVNAASLEWSSNGEGHILDTVRMAINEWHVNHVRLPLAQDRWFGKAPDQKDEGVAYRALVKQVVDLCSETGCYLILDLHWSDLGGGASRSASTRCPTGTASTSGKTWPQPTKTTQP